MVALLAGIGATSGSCAGGHACSPESSRLDEQQQRDMRDDGARGRSNQRHGPAQPAGQGGDQHAMKTTSAAKRAASAAIR
jgi:hypothetical protein